MKNPTELTFEEFKNFFNKAQTQAKADAEAFAKSRSKVNESMENLSLEQVLEETGSVLLEDFISKHPV